MFLAPSAAAWSPRPGRCISGRPPPGPRPEGPEARLDGGGVVPGPPTSEPSGHAHDLGADIGIGDEIRRRGQRRRPLRDRRGAGRTAEHPAGAGRAPDRWIVHVGVAWPALGDVERRGGDRLALVGEPTLLAWVPGDLGQALGGLRRRALLGRAARHAVERGLAWRGLRRSCGLRGGVGLGGPGPGGDLLGCPGLWRGLLGCPGPLAALATRGAAASVDAPAMGLMPPPKTGDCMKAVTSWPSLSGSGSPTRPATLAVRFPAPSVAWS